MKKLRVTVDGKSYDVVVEVLGETQTSPAAYVAPAPAPSAPAPAPTAAAPAARPAAGAGAVLSPLAGKVVSVDVKPGEVVAAGKQVATIEAMKMNTFIFAEQGGTVAAVMVAAGDSVEEGAPILQLA